MVKVPVEGPYLPSAAQRFIRAMLRLRISACSLSDLEGRANAAMSLSYMASDSGPWSFVRCIQSSKRFRSFFSRDWCLGSPAKLRTSNGSAARS